MSRAIMNDKQTLAVRVALWRAMGKREQAAIEAVARHFSATWKRGGGDSPDAYATIAGKRIAVEVTATKPRIAERRG
jgi:hypothetical protein